MRTKKNKFWYIQEFCKEYKILSVTFGICILLAIKSSTVPFFAWTPKWLISIFQTPSVPGVENIIDSLTYSYMCSVIFFYIVNFLPEIRNRKKANDITLPIVDSIHFYLTELIARIEFVKAKQGVSSYNDLILNNDRYYVKISNNGQKATYEYIELSNNVNKYCDLIIKDCDRLNSLYIFNDIDFEIREMISALSASETLYYVMCSSKYVKANNYKIIQLEKEMDLITNSKTILDKHNGMKQCIIVGATEDEMEKYFKFL